MADFKRFVSIFCFTQEVNQGIPHSTLIFLDKFFESHEVLAVVILALHKVKLIEGKQLIRLVVQKFVDGCFQGLAKRLILDVYETSFPV